MFPYLFSPIHKLFKSFVFFNYLKSQTSRNDSFVINDIFGQLTSYRICLSINLRTFLAVMRYGEQKVGASGFE